MKTYTTEITTNTADDTLFLKFSEMFLHITRRDTHIF